MTMILQKIRGAIAYYLFSSYRRKLIDKLLSENSVLYHGTVLDIGGRDRGKFKSPKEKVDKWIIGDIERKRNPDFILDVTSMPSISKDSIDVVNAIELFEHVDNINAGINECYRILKQGGVFIISMPFLYPIHADPFDYQRWTMSKWKQSLEKTGFQVEKIKPMGGFFTVLADSLKTLNTQFFVIFRYILFVFYPVLDLLTWLDKTKFITHNRILSNYTTGYFIVAKKK